MKHPIRALALACALTLMPACAALHLNAPNPIAAAQTTDQRAYALIQSYGALIETATSVVRDPSVPMAAKRAIGRAEAAATPAVSTLEVAFSAYLRARAAYEAASRADEAALTHALNALNAASQALAQAIDRAQAPLGELQSLINAHRGVAR
ncbi:MAG: hypothetical protein HY054_13940 [Proteobacteria bacterium]|nr:hypothetical protein [Pseudomonadota bacterium]